MIFTKLYIRIFKIIVNILSTNKKIQYIGTEYGGWYILKNTEIRDGVILSAGVGEDISSPTPADKITPSLISVFFKIYQPPYSVPIYCIFLLVDKILTIILNIRI